MTSNHTEQYIFLADQPELLPILADWFFEEWGHLYPHSSRESIQRELQDFLNKDHIPLTFISLQGGKPIATASLKIREMETHPQYLYWLGGVYVHPDHRGQGIGSQLVEFSAALAKKLNVYDLYLYTRSHENFYTRLGWSVIERPQYEGRVAIVMKRNLSVDTEKE